MRMTILFAEFVLLVTLATLASPAQAFDPDAVKLPMSYSEFFPRYSDFGGLQKISEPMDRRIPLKSGIASKCQFLLGDYEEMADWKRASVPGLCLIYPFNQLTADLLNSQPDTRSECPEAFNRLARMRKG